MMPRANVATATVNAGARFRLRTAKRTSRVRASMSMPAILKGPPGNPDTGHDFHGSGTIPARNRSKQAVASPYTWREEA
jgi:hypothetical protein